MNRFRPDAVADPHRPGWTLTFHDEFDGPTIDRTKWSTDYLSPNQGEAAVVDEALELRDSLLRIKLDKRETFIEQDRTHKRYDYTSGCINTQLGPRFAQQYGWWEIRSRMPSGSGIHSAFWLMPADDSYGPLVEEGGTRESVNESYEIDIFEQLGRDPHTINMVSHHGRKSGLSTFDLAKPRSDDVDFSKDFHTVALEWTPTELIWHLDGEPVHRSAKPPHSPFYIIINLYIGCGWTGDIDPDLTYPRYFEIDYVRVYQRTKEQQLEQMEEEAVAAAPMC